jgi:hypothetical protein
LIPLDTVYSTFNQEGLKSLPEVETDGLFQVLGAVRESPQQIVLCIGTDAASAVKGSELSFAMPEEAIPPVTGTTSEKTLWLAAYLGCDGSLPPAFRVSSIEVNGKTIRVMYERDASPVRSADLRSYLIWVPLGRLEEGVYTLELFDAAAERVTRSRSWQVTVN